MKGLIRKITYFLRTSRHPFARIKAWAKEPRKRHRRLRRWRAWKRVCKANRKRAKPDSKARRRWARRQANAEDKIEKLVRLINESKLDPESWMASGHEYHNLTPRAKKLLAIAVVRYGLVCTSITRNWGGDSHHESIPTPGFDSAGANMEEFQTDLRYGRVEGFKLSDLLELIGPNNDAWAKNGAPWSGWEGAPLEEAHDNHTHSMVYG